MKSEDSKISLNVASIKTQLEVIVTVIAQNEHMLADHSLFFNEHGEFVMGASFELPTDEVDEDGNVVTKLVRLGDIIKA